MRIGLDWGGRMDCGMKCLWERERGEVNLMEIVRKRRGKRMIGG